MTDSTRTILAGLLTLVLAQASCGGDAPPVPGGGDVDTDSDSDSDVDSDADSDSDSDGDSDTDSDSDSDSDSDGDTGPLPTPCEELQAEDPDVVCCPETPPEDCDESNWEFSDYGGDHSVQWFGCCTGDLTTVVYCGGGSGMEYRNIDCTEEGQTCGLTTCQGDDCMDCDDF